MADSPAAQVERLLQEANNVGVKPKMLSTVDSIADHGTKIIILQQSIEQQREINEQKEKINEQKEKINEQEEKIKKLSLYNALTYLDGVALIRRGTDSSHVNTHHLPAKFNLLNIDLPRVDHGMRCCTDEGADENTFATKLMNTDCHAVFTSGEPFAQEADIQDMVHNVLKDATFIVQILLGFDVKKSRAQHILQVRREENLLSNRVDHSAVHIRNLKTPLITVEDKKPHKDATDGERVVGQVFDQFLDTIILSWNGVAIGAITSLQKTRVAWMGEQAGELLVPGDLLQETKLSQARGILLKMEDGKPEISQNSPPPKRWDPGPTQEVETRKQGSKRVKAQPRRLVNLSDEISTSELLHVFCNLIIAGILLQHGEKPVLYQLDKDYKLSIDHCVKIEEGLKIPSGAAVKVERLDTTITGHAEKPGNVVQGVGESVRKLVHKEFFIINLIGRGKWTKAFRAVTHDSRECVLKMYVNMYDETGEKLEDFSKKGREWVETVETLYQRVYPELEKYIWIEWVCGRPCLVLPCFAPINLNEHNDGQLKACYQHILKQGYWLRKENIKWRDIGVFQGKMYLHGVENLELKAAADAAASSNANSDVDISDFVDSADKFYDELILRAQNWDLLNLEVPPLPPAQHP